MFNWAKVAAAGKPMAATIDRPASANVHKAASDRKLETLEARVRREQSR